jgi:hypothetical protein
VPPTYSRFGTSHGSTWLAEALISRVVRTEWCVQSTLRRHRTNLKIWMEKTRCLRNEQLRRLAGTDARAGRPPHRLANSCGRKFTRSAAVSTARNHQNRQSPSVSRRPGGPACVLRRRRKAKPRREPAEARSTPMRRDSTSARSAAGHASLVPSRGCSSVSPGARRRVRLFRATPDAPRRTAPDRSAPSPRARQSAQKDRRADQRRPRRRPGRERAVEPKSK